MVSAMSLATLAAVQSALNITGTTTAEDTFLQRQIDLAEAIIVDYLGRRIELDNYRDTFRDPYIVQTVETPIVQIYSVTQDGATVTSPRTLPDSGRIMTPATDSYRDWNGTEELVVTYQAGYATIPAPILEVLYIAVQRKWEEYQDVGTVSESLGAVRSEAITDVGNVSYAGTGVMEPALQHPILGVALASLDHYRAPRLMVAQANPDLHEVGITP